MTVSYVGPPMLPLRLVKPEDLAGVAGNRRYDPQQLTKSQIEASVDRLQTDRDAIREKGLYAWAKEEKYKALREKIEREVRAEMGLDEAALSKLSDDQRVSLEAKIQLEIQRRVEEALKQAAEEESKKAAATGQPPAPMFIDISV